MIFYLFPLSNKKGIPHQYKCWWFYFFSLLSQLLLWHMTWLLLQNYLSSTYAPPYSFKSKSQKSPWNSTSLWTAYEAFSTSPSWTPVFRKTGGQQWLFGVTCLPGTKYPHQGCKKIWPGGPQNQRAGSELCYTLHQCVPRDALWRYIAAYPASKVVPTGREAV